MVSTKGILGRAAGLATGIALGTALLAGATMSGLLPANPYLRHVLPDSFYTRPFSSQEITMADSLDKEIILFEADQHGIFIDEVYDTFDGNAWHQTRPFSAEPSGNEEISDIVKIDGFSSYLVASYGKRKESATRRKSTPDPVYTKPIMEIPESVSQALLLYLQDKGYTATSLEGLTTEWQEKISSSREFNDFCDSIASFFSSNTYYLNEGYQKRAAPLIAEIENAENRADKALENLVGDCEYASTFLSAILREIGIPTRHVGGWKAKRAKTNNGHAMTQAFNPYTGWTVFDATATTQLKDEPVTDCQCLFKRITHNASRSYAEQKQLPVIRVIGCIEDIKEEIREYEETDPVQALRIQKYLKEEFRSHWYDPQIEPKKHLIWKIPDVSEAINIAADLQDRPLLNEFLYQAATTLGLGDPVYEKIIQANKFYNSNASVEAKAFVRLSKQSQDKLIEKMVTYNIEHPGSLYPYQLRSTQNHFTQEQNAMVLSRAFEKVEEKAGIVCSDDSMECFSHVYNLRDVKAGIKLIKSNPSYRGQYDDELDRLKNEAIKNHRSIFKHFYSQDLMREELRRARHNDITYP
ncbi:MAG: transglutaminase-like domain-containing protein [Nanobdellota archaeon]